MSSSSVELGFVEKRAAWKLRSKFFPSKVGGQPAWLRLNNLPQRSDLLCKKCTKPLLFLTQIYAPVFEVESAFHRTIFIFMCRDGKCNNNSIGDNFAVYRSQLPRENEFYSFEPPIEEEKSSSNPSAQKYQSLCEVCNCPAILKCPHCSEKDYCCEQHRESDFKWNHKSECESKKENTSKQKKPKNYFLLPEFDLVTETEKLPPTAPEKSDEEKMRDFRQFMQSSKAPRELQDMPMDDLDDVMKKNDKAFNKFQKRVKLEPEQVLRYQRGETPLWVSFEGIPTAIDIPNCTCGAKRVFEFQIMPQLLNYLSLDAIQDGIDWGTLIIFTCSKSCESGHEGYAQEFIWKQDFSDNK